MPRAIPIKKRPYLKFEYPEVASLSLNMEGSPPFSIKARRSLLRVVRKTYKDAKIDRNSTIGINSSKLFMICGFKCFYDFKLCCYDAGIYFRLQIKSENFFIYLDQSWTAVDYMHIRQMQKVKYWHNGYVKAMKELCQSYFVDNVPSLQSRPHIGFTYPLWALNFCLQIRQFTSGELEVLQINRL